MESTALEDLVDFFLMADLDDFWNISRYTCPSSSVASLVSTPEEYSAETVAMGKTDDDDAMAAAQHDAMMAATRAVPR